MDFDTSLHLTDEQVARYLLALTFVAIFYPILFRTGKWTVKKLRGFFGKIVPLYHNANSYLLKFSHTKEIRH